MVGIRVEIVNDEICLIHDNGVTYALPYSRLRNQLYRDIEYLIKRRYPLSNMVDVQAITELIAVLGLLEISI